MVNSILIDKVDIGIVDIDVDRTDYLIQTNNNPHINRSLMDLSIEQI